MVFGALTKNGIFGFAKSRLVCRAKPNMPFLRLAKIVFKKCAVKKNKNTEALAFGSAVCWFICPVTLCLFLSFILAVSFFRLAGNSRIPATKNLYTPSVFGCITEYSERLFFNLITPNHQIPLISGKPQLLASASIPFIPPLKFFSNPSMMIKMIS